MALTDAQRSRASKMFSDGKSTEQVAKSLKISLPSARALRANWTRSNAPTPARATRGGTRLTPTEKPLLPLNDARRERAARMFAEGKTTEQVAKNVRVSIPSARALRANWTRSNA